MERHLVSFLCQQNRPLLPFDRHLKCKAAAVREDYLWSSIPHALRQPCFETVQDLRLLHPSVPFVGRMDLQYASDGRYNSKDNCQY